MSTTSLPVNDLHLPVPSSDWIGRLPDGAVSIETDGTHWLLRASHALQSKFEELLERRKAGQLTAEETHEYDAICDLDSLLSGFNRLARRVQQG
ncbi:MAG TPA: hypothetical protein VM165_08275 [Planctomycetaceae bacterium]|nr:hypothetical protein [Planctomycetaceae bacterium]